ncbi:MAG: histidine kinase [Clostridiales bacterium]|nr:histidine kinase [Clostridiales bacterium]
MTANRPKTKISYKCLLLFIAAVAVYCIIISAFFICNAFYNEIYDTPRVKHGAADYSDTDWKNRLTAHSIAGEWEFFYNRWIITDNDNGDNDGFISIPGRWTGKTVNGKTLTRFGYASYRLTVKNVTAGQLITCFADNSVVGLRMFINGKLCAISGVVSKEATESTSGRSTKSDYIISDGGDITIVIETGYTSNGGLTCAPRLDYTMTSPTYWYFLERFAAVSVFGLAVGAFLMTLVMTLAFRRYDKDITLPMLIGMLCLHFFFSKDVTIGIGLYGYGAVWIPAIITGILTVAVFAVHILKLSGALNKKNLLPLTAVLIACVIAYGVLYGTGYTVIPALIYLLSSLYPLYPLIATPKINAKFKIVYALIYLLTIGTLSMEVIDGTGACAFGTEYFFALALTMVILAQCVASFLRLYNFSRKLIRMNELEHEVEQAKLRALTAQIKPHFVFNSLNAIQAQYHKNLDDGDSALQNFAGHLRSTIVAGNGENLISFDKEVQNVLNYFDLENLRADGALTLLLDLNERDFSLPELSLQPFVENAVKYADTQSVKDGYIKLSSEKAENAVIVTIADNGKGFDMAGRHNGVGIDNSCERLKRLAGAEVNIESQTNKGTRVTVTIPVKENKN